ncbi:MAG: GDSL-type esterase/lipase family protein [Bacilli bacterium]|jgi:lysophospholipase L1-like esterase
MNPSTSTSNSEPLKILNVNLYEGYASYPIRAFFGNEPIADPDLYYEIEDESICEISNNMAIPLQIGTSQVIASTDDGRETTFIVRVKSHTELRFHADVLSREEEFNLTVNPDPSPTLFIGDSFFDPRVFWRSFYDDFEGLNCFSAGISGSKADDWIHFRKRLIDNISPKQIVMHIGTNDVNDSEKPTFKPLDYYKQITRFLDLVLSESPDVKIYFFGIENRSGSSGYESKNLYVEAVTKMIEEEFAPAYSNQFVYMDSPAVFNADQQRYLSSDGIHPSPEGYAYYVSFLKGLLEF